MESKILKNVKARCEVNGHYIVLQVDDEGGKQEIAGYSLLTDASSIKGAQSNVRLTSPTVNARFKSCSVCGQSKPFGCSCAAKKCKGGYKCLGRECIFCSKLIPDYTTHKGARNPQYNDCAGISNVMGEKDIYGNAQGSSADLARDGAFKGKKIAVLHLYTGEGFDFAYPTAALETKGFTISRRTTLPATGAELRKFLKDACQLWIISTTGSNLSTDHINVIREFFNSGRGLYVWGDNQPYYYEANMIMRSLFSTEMSGNYVGNQVLGISPAPSSPGIIKDHLITTGLVNFYEGITVARIQEKDRGGLKPLMYSSDGNVVAAYYDQDGKRAIVDGGFTRLFFKWQTAGTDRYVKNAAAWLANVERFQDEY